MLHDADIALLEQGDAIMMNDEVLDTKKPDFPPAADGEPRITEDSSSRPSQTHRSKDGRLPKGGVQAWLQVLGGFSIFFNTWGLIATYGVFQTYYESGALFHASSSNIAWIRAIQTSCTFLTCTLTGPIFDHGYLRLLLAVGAFLIFFGLMMVSLCHNLWQLILAQGFCIGIGSGPLFATVNPIISQYFDRHLGFATGLAALGSAVGGSIYPIAFHKLLPSTGFGWSVRILGFIALATLLPLVFIRRRVKPTKPRGFFDWTAFKDPPYLIYITGQIFSVIGLYTILFYISFFSISTSITDANISFYIIPIMNAGSLFGRVLPNILADEFGPLNIMPVAAFVSAVLTFCMIPVSSKASLVVLALLFGFFSGVFVALPAVAVVLLTTDRSRTGARGPGGGRVLEDYSKSLDWTALWVYGGVANLIAGVLFLVAKWLHEMRTRNSSKSNIGASH
jgi:MFS family permease